MIEKSKESGDRGDKFGALFTDLCKAFDCIDHNLLIPKLSCYGLTTKSLNLGFSYSRDRELGPLLFNIDMTDLFPKCDDDNINSYADDTGPYSCAEDITVITELQRTANKIFRWLKIII